MGQKWPEYHRGPLVRESRLTTIPTYLSVILNGLLVVPEEVVSVAEVTNGPALSRHVP